MSDDPKRALDAAELERLNGLAIRGTPDLEADIRGEVVMGIGRSGSDEEIVTTDCGFYGPGPDDARLFAASRPTILDIIAELTAIRALVHAKPVETTVAAVERWQREFIDRIDVACGVRR